MKLQEFRVVTNRGILGPPGYHDCVQSIRVLGRIVEWTADGITWEADPRHAELIRKSFGVTRRSVTTPEVRDKLTDIEGEEGSDRQRSVGSERQARFLGVRPRQVWLFKWQKCVTRI